MSSNCPFICNICSHTFTRKENLERHKRSRHGGNDGIRRPFECPLCHNTFLRRDVCKRHTDRCRGGRTGRRPGSSGERGDGQEAATLPSPPIVPVDDTAVAGGSAFDRTDLPSQSPEESLSLPAFSAPKSPQSMPSEEAAGGYIADYFESFHPSFPLLHRPSVGAESPQVLRNIIMAIGSLHRARRLPENEAQACLQCSQDLWDSGRRALSQMVQADWRELRRTWVMQAWLLHVVYGAFMGDAGRYNKAKKMLRLLVDAAQDLGLLRHSVTTATASESWAKACGNTSQVGDRARQELWMRFVDEESTKLAMYTILFLNFHVFSPCNIQSSLSSLELEWELPFSSVLWEAETAQAWLERLNLEPRVMASLKADWTFNIEYSSMRSLALTTQSLMSDSPNPNLLASLAASPFTTLFVLTNLGAFVRDFTRCYYQLPPSLPDPSPYHIFTQTQNKQVMVALRHVSRVVAEQRPKCDPKTDGPLWAAAARIALSIKIALCRPDDLLIGGIVDSSVVAGLATATHLTLGFYSGARRSLQSLLQQDSGDDAILVVLGEVVDVLLSDCSGTSIGAGGGGAAGRKGDDNNGNNSQGHKTDANHLAEPPWTTIASYRVLLATWRSLRWATSEIRKRPRHLMNAADRFQPSEMIFNAITEAVVPREAQISGMISWDGSSTGFVPPELTESHFTAAILRFWNSRSTWPIGSAMANVLEEIISADYA